MAEENESHKQFRESVSILIDPSLQHDKVFWGFKFWFWEDLLRLKASSSLSSVINDMPASQNDVVTGKDCLNQLKADTTFT